MPSDTQPDESHDPATISEESLSGVYRRASRFNRDPFSRINRKRQTWLMVFGLITILLQISVGEIEKVSEVGVTVKMAPHSLEKIAFVMACVTAYFLAAFALGAARDFANDRYRRFSTSPDFLVPIRAAADTTKVRQTAGSVLEESNRLIAMAGEEESVRDNLRKESERRSNEIEQQVETLERELSTLVGDAARRHGIPEPPYIDYYQLKTLNKSFDTDEWLACDRLLGDVSSLKQELEELPQKRFGELEASLQRQEKLMDQAKSLVEDWREKNQANDRRIEQLTETLGQINMYRQATKWVEAIFPCFLGFVAVAVEILNLVTGDWSLVFTHR